MEEKFILTLDRQKMADNNLTEELLSTFSGFGEILPYIEPPTPLITDEEADTLKCGLERERERADKAEAVLAAYAPLIGFIKAMNAESENRMEELTKRAEAAEAAMAVLTEISGLIEGAKRPKG